jgi:O-antigen/teichoic acid export membrane protein
MLYMLPVVVGTLLFPKLTAMNDPHEKWRATKRIGVAVGALMLATCAIALVLAKPAIRILFGTAFLPAAPALLLLLPGLVCLSVSSVLSAYIASIDIPRVIVWIYLGAFVLNVLLNLLLLRRFGICAASVNSTIAYGFSHICLWVLARGRMRPDAVMKSTAVWGR